MESSYKQAIEDTLSRGGDTDTNAAIVGGMIGALHGVNNISEQLRSKVFSRDPAQGNSRPQFLHPGQVPSMAKQLYQMGLQQIGSVWHFHSYCWHRSAGMYWCTRSQISTEMGKTSFPRWSGSIWIRGGTKNITILPWDLAKENKVIKHVILRHCQSFFIVMQRVVIDDTPRK